LKKNPFKLIENQIVLQKANIFNEVYCNYVMHNPKTVLQLCVSFLICNVGNEDAAD